MALSETAQAIFDDLPPYFWGEPTFERIVQAFANELDRLRDTTEALVEGYNPATATDAQDMLAAWEATLGLPVRPLDVTEVARRNTVLAALRKRRAASGRSWVEALTTAIGSSQWSHVEHESGPYTLLIEIPFDPGSYNAQQVEDLARRITPANIEIIMRYEVGFLVGISHVGEEAL